MANEFYEHSTYPSTGSPLSSAAMRLELDAIQGGFDKLPALAGNGNSVVKVNAAGVALVVGNAVVGDVVGTTDTQTLTNKTISFANNTLTGVQAALVSGTNIKTVGGQSLLGSGDISVGTGDVTLNGVQTLTNKTITGTRETRVAMPASNIDLLAGNYFTRTISGATTLTVSNVPASGTSASFILDLTNGGSAAITWWANVRWAGGTAPTLTASGRDVLGFFTHDAGANWTGLLLGKDVK